MSARVSRDAFSLLAFLVRALVWFSVAVMAGYAVRNPTPQSAGEAIGTAPPVLFLTALPGLLFLFAIRTWLGTALASVGFWIVTLAVFLWVSAGSETSSTAGIGVLIVVPLLVLVVGLVFAWEHRKPTRQIAAIRPPTRTDSL
jgi:hypothetical protein